MKTIGYLLFLIAMLQSAFLGAAPIYTTVETQIHLKKDIKWHKEDWDIDDRSLDVTLTATHDNTSIHLYSYETVEEAIVTVTDFQGNIVVYSTAYIYPGQSFSLPLNVGKGKYCLEVEYKEYCYYGYFEI